MMMDDVSAKLMQSMRVRCAFGVRSMRANDDDDARGATIFSSLFRVARLASRDVDRSTTSTRRRRFSHRSLPDRHDAIDRAGLFVSKLRSIS